MRRSWKALLAVVTLMALTGAPAFGQNSPFPLQQTATLQAAAVATGNGSLFPTGQMAAVTLQASGTLTSLTLAFEATNDGTNFVALTCFTLDGQTSVTGTSATGIWRCDTNGIAGIRARVSVYSSGTVTVTANGTSNAMPVRDQIAISGAITGQLRGTQTTAPTCGTVNGGGTQTTLSCVMDGGGTDSFIRAHIATGLTATQTSPVVSVTFNTAYAATPSCVAAYDSAYGYYIYAVTPTTTTVQVKLGRPLSVLTPAAAYWGVQDSFSVLCAGVQ